MNFIFVIEVLNKCTSFNFVSLSDQISEKQKKQNLIQNQCYSLIIFHKIFHNQQQAGNSNQMGCASFSSKQQCLTVATLNYSGILTSPYEYYELDNEHERKINKTFSEYTQKKYPNFNDLNEKGEPIFTWNMGSIDTKWKDRYAAINILEAGVKKNGNMMNQQEFSIEWEERKEQTIKKLKADYFKKKNLKETELKEVMDSEIQRCKQFDLLCYQTLLKVYCNVSDFKNMGNVESKKYQDARKEQFSKPFLSESEKLNKTINSINSINYDILFFQETNKTLIQGLKNEADKYHVIDGTTNSIILIKKSLVQNQINFQKSNLLFLQKYQFQLKRKLNEQVKIEDLKKRLNFNDDSIFQGFEKFILINVHISSRKQMNPQQIRNFCAEVCKMLKVLPDYHLICGGDFNARLKINQFVEQSKNELLKSKYGQSYQRLDIAPVLTPDSNTLTVKKKRTLMQPQRHKAEILDEETKDFFISTLEMTKKQIVLINGQKIKKDSPLSLLPNRQHPYDHYMVLVELHSSRSKMNYRETESVSQNKQNIS